jgi:hypothetical protein
MTKFIMAVTFDDSSPLISCPECGCGREYIKTTGEEVSERIMYRTFCSNCFWSTSLRKEVTQCERDWNEQIFTASSLRPPSKCPDINISVINRTDDLQWGVLADLEIN